jgi:hypothetical protein
MKIDKKTVDMLLTMNDDALWQMIRSIAAGNGAKDVPAKRPDDLDMTGIRNMLANLTDGDIKRACEIIEQYKK